VRLVFLLLFFIFSFNCLSNENGAIYANSDGSYTYFGQNYTFNEFPMDKVLVVENKVHIFPVEGLSMEESLVRVKPLARKFIKAGYEVETKINGFIIPYIVQKKGK
jgi:hypothetical protein